MLQLMDSLRSKSKQKAEDNFSHRQKLEHIMRLLESSNPSIHLHREKIEEHFSKLTRVPDHPPYASMIERAITELNEEEGSSEQTISKFIEAKYEDLPIAHATQLTHHLQKLVSKGEIVRTSANCYMLSFENSDSLPKTKKGHKHLRRSGRNGKNSRQHNFKGVLSKKEKDNKETRKQKLVHQKILEEIEEQKQAEQQIGPIGEHNKQGHFEMTKAQNEVDEVQLKVSGEQIEAEQERDGVEEHDQLQNEVDEVQLKVSGEQIDAEQERDGVEEHDQLQNELEEVQLKVIGEQIEAEQEREGVEAHEQLQEWQDQQQKELNLWKSQVLSGQIDVNVEENYQAEGTNQAEKNCEVTAKVVEEHAQLQEGHNQQQKELNLQKSQILSEQIAVTVEENFQAEGTYQDEKNYEVTTKMVEEHAQLLDRKNQQQKEWNLQNIQVLSEQIDVTIEENHEAEGTNHAEKNCEVTEHEREEEDQGIEGLGCKEQESKKFEEKNQIKNQEREVRDKQAQLPDIRIEETVEQIISEAQHFGMSEEQKRLQEQKMEVCCQIIDLRNMLQQFLRKEKEDQAPMSAHNYATTDKEDIFGSSDLTKEDLMELLKTTHKVEGKLIDIITCMNLEVLDNNNSKPKIGGQRELLEDHLLQTQNPCTGSETVLVCGFQPKQQQQLEIGCEAQASEYQPKTILASVNLSIDSMQLEQNHKTEFPSQKRPPEVETATLEELLGKQNKQIKLCNQQEANKSQPKSMEVTLDVSCDSPHDENESAQLAIQRIEPLLEEDSLTTKPNIKFSGEAAISGPETKKSYLDVFMDGEQLPNSEPCDQGKLPESQLVSNSPSVPVELQELDLELQRQTSKNKVERPECKQPENLFEGRHVEHGARAAEPISQMQQQMVEQGQLIQLQPLGKMTFASRVDIPTSVAKNHDQTQQMQKQLPPRQLRPRGRRPSESEPAVTTFEADYDLTLTSMKSGLKQKSQPSIPKRPQEQSRNHHGQKKWLKTQPTTIIADSITASQQQANLRLRQIQPQCQCSSQTGSAMQKTSEESLPFQYKQHGQKQPQPRRRGRPPKLKSDVNTAKGKSMALEHQHGQQQSHRRRGRPSKPKADANATAEESLLSNHQDRKDKQPEHRSGQRTAKSKSTTLLPQHELKNQ